MRAMMEGGVIVVPTPVGVNLTKTGIFLEIPGCPHARGGEPGRNCSPYRLQ